MVRGCGREREREKGVMCRTNILKWSPHPPVPLAVLITLSVAIPLIFYLVVPVLVILLRPWLFNTSRRPTPPGSDASRLKRFLFGWFVG